MIFSKFDCVSEIEKGWSGDKKYCAVKGGKKYLIRISTKRNYKKIKNIHKIMKLLAENDISMCQPIKVGLCKRGTYILQSWVDGIDAEENIHNYSKEQQYHFGFQAGKTLQEIHTISAPKRQQEWEIRFSNKMDRKIKMYYECPIKPKGAKYIIDYLNANRDLLKNRPQCFQHGDYHIGNMMIENDKIVIIDFDRYDFGDPWEEFNRIVWAAQVSPEFASGMINGYFDNDVPELFWKLLKLYIGSNTLSSVPWAMPFGDEQINVMLNQAKEVLEWYDNYKLLIPKWYTQNYMQENNCENMIIQNKSRNRLSDSKIEKSEENIIKGSSNKESGKNLDNDKKQNSDKIESKIKQVLKYAGSIITIVSVVFTAVIFLFNLFYKEECSRYYGIDLNCFNADKYALRWVAVIIILFYIFFVFFSSKIFMKKHKDILFRIVWIIISSVVVIFLNSVLLVSIDEYSSNDKIVEFINKDIVVSLIFLVIISILFSMFMIFLLQPIKNKILIIIIGIFGLFGVVFQTVYFSVFVLSYAAPNPENIKQYTVITEIIEQNNGQQQSKFIIVGDYDGGFICMNIQRAVDDKGNNIDLNTDCSLDNAILTVKKGEFQIKAVSEIEKYNTYHLEKLNLLE